MRATCPDLELDLNNKNNGQCITTIPDSSYLCPFICGPSETICGTIVEGTGTLKAGDVITYDCSNTSWKYNDNNQPEYLTSNNFCCSAGTAPSPERWIVCPQPTPPTPPAPKPAPTQPPTPSGWCSSNYKVNSSRCDTRCIPSQDPNNICIEDQMYCLTEVSPELTACPTPAPLSSSSY